MNDRTAKYESEAVASVAQGVLSTVDFTASV